MAAQLVTQLFTALVQAAPDLLLAGLELIYGIISGVTSGLGDIVSSAGEIIETISTAFGDKIDDFLSIGGDIVKGIWDGISAGTEWIFEKIKGWVDDVVEWICDLLGIASPSKVMKAEVGFWMARGVGEGFEEEMDSVNRQIAKSINTSFDLPEFTFGGNGYRPRSYNTSSGKVVNLYFTAKTITEAEVNMVIDLVNRKLGDAIA
jgi:phage-related protein